LRALCQSPPWPRAATAPKRAFPNAGLLRLLPGIQDRSGSIVESHDPSGGRFGDSYRYSFSRLEWPLPQPLNAGQIDNNPGHSGCQRPQHWPTPGGNENGDPPGDGHQYRQGVEPHAEGNARVSPAAVQQDQPNPLSDKLDDAAHRQDGADYGKQIQEQ